MLSSFCLSTCKHIAPCMHAVVSRVNKISQRMICLHTKEHSCYWRQASYSGHQVCLMHFRLSRKQQKHLKASTQVICLTFLVFILAHSKRCREIKKKKHYLSGKYCDTSHSKRVSVWVSRLQYRQSGSFLSSVELMAPTFNSAMHKITAVTRSVLIGIFGQAWLVWKPLKSFIFYSHIWKKTHVNGHFQLTMHSQNETQLLNRDFFLKNF